MTARGLAWARGLMGVLVVATFALPIVTLTAAWGQWVDPATRSVLTHLVQTVLPEYTAVSMALCVMVGLGVLLVGVGSAVLVGLTTFAGRAVLAWALLLPMAMPAYVVAYAYTDLLQFSGPLQSALRAWTGHGGRWFPEIRNVWGAAWVFTWTLYPYVYLLTLAALRDRATGLLQAARMLGAPGWQRLTRVALPLARPAIVAGTALALMETLADYGVASYFGIQTYTAGIYKAWLAMDDHWAAAQLATVLLLWVTLLLLGEQWARRQQRFADRNASLDAQPLRLGRWATVAAWLVGGLPVILGFGLPVLALLRPLALAWSDLPWGAYLGWVAASLRLGLAGAALAVALAAVLVFAQRVSPNALTRTAHRLGGLGYALPGAVVVVGLLLGLDWLQSVWPAAQPARWLLGWPVALMWAYAIRFTPVALHSLDAAYTRISPNQDAAARLLGSSGWSLWWRVHQPQLRASLGAALILVFVDTLKELPATLVLRPFDSDTLAVMAFQLARDERLGEAALPALTLVVVGLLPVLLLSHTLRFPGAHLKSTG